MEKRQNQIKITIKYNGISQYICYPKIHFNSIKLYVTESVKSSYTEKKTYLENVKNYIEKKIEKL